MVETRSGYPFFKGKYGIPFKDLLANTRGIVRGGSGRFLRYGIKDSSIDIEDEEFSGYGLFAEVNRNIFKASVFTRRYMTGERHPDLFARKFLIFAYEYFIANGYDINRIATYWTASVDKFTSINFDQYSEAFAKGFSSEDAARSTWSGRLAGEIGFTEVEQITIDKANGIEAIFKRPDQN